MVKKALFWDFDGTLIHPNESFACALKLSLESMEYPTNIIAIREFLHSACSWYKPEVSYEKHTGSKWWEALFTSYDAFYNHNGINKADRKELNRLFKEYILNDKNYALYKDAKEVLQKCKFMGYENYILSNNFPELPTIVEKLELSEYIRDYIVSSNVGFEKPRIELFQYALHIAQYPDVCYMIGDNPIADIQGGKNAGMTTILVHRGKNNQADYSCDNLGELLAIIAGTAGTSTATKKG